MAHYERSNLAENRARFRRNRNPGPGMVEGPGTLGTLQQVLWYPQHDTGRHDIVFRKDSNNNARLIRQVYSRRGNLLAEYTAMDSVATAGPNRQFRRIRQLGHFVTTSSYGDTITRALKDGAALPHAELKPEQDRYRTPGISGLIATGSLAPHRTGGRREVAVLAMLAHRLAPQGDFQSMVHYAPQYDALNDMNFEPGVGVGMHAYDDGVGRQPFTGYRYAFPLGSSAENTLDIYHDLLGKRRGVNIAVKELLGSSAMTLVVANASGEPA